MYPSAIHNEPWQSERKKYEATLIAMNATALVTQTDQAIRQKLLVWDIAIIEL